MMHIRGMTMLVGNLVVQMHMAVFAGKVWFMRVGVMAIFVIVPMIMLKRFVCVHVTVLFDRGKIRPGYHNQ